MHCSTGSPSTATTPCRTELKTARTYTKQRSAVTEPTAADHVVSEQVRAMLAALRDRREDDRLVTARLRRNTIATLRRSTAGRSVEGDHVGAEQVGLVVDAADTCAPYAEAGCHGGDEAVAVDHVR